MAKVDEKEHKEHGIREHKRMIVEEVGSEVPSVEVEDIPKDGSTEVVSSETKEPLEVVKEKVEELQTLTEGIAESVEKSVEVQEELAKVAGSDDFIPLDKNSTGPKPLLIIIPGVLLLGALLGGIVFYQSSVNTQKNIKDAELTETPIPTEATEMVETSTPSATLDLTKYKVAILNGSGIGGEAGKVKTILTDAKFVVSTTGNASTYDYTKTIVKAKSTVDAAFVSKLVDTLGAVYVVDKAQTLSTSSTSDVQVVVGTSKK